MVELTQPGAGGVAGPGVKHGTGHRVGAQPHVVHVPSLQHNMAIAETMYVLWNPGLSTCTVQHDDLHSHCRGGA